MLCLAACPAAAQLRALGGGCTVPSGGTAGAVDSEGQRPAIGNLEFRLAYTCPAASTAVLAIYGRCLDRPDYRLFAPSPCGLTCVQVVDPRAFVLAGADIPSEGAPGLLPIGIPHVPSLVGTTLCVQFLCVDLTSPRASCQEISQGCEIKFES